MHNRDSITLTLKKSGAGVVLASDIELPHDVEIINPEHVIANLTDNGKLDMQIKVEKGRGYVPGNVRRLSEDANKTIGRIFWTLLSHLSAVFPMLLNPLVSNNVPIWTS